jgi:type I restriction enzyme S subunit
MMQNNEVRWVPLGKYIEQTDSRNTENTLCESAVRGISVDKIFTSTKADLNGVSLSSYKIVHPNEFAYVADTSRRGNKISLAYNLEESDLLISSIYTSFRIKSNLELLDLYLYIWFCRDDFNRFARFHSWGSARETLSWSTFCEIKIPVPFKNGEPDVERQQEIVDVWEGLRKLRDENLAIAEPLFQLCQSKIEELKHEAPMVELDKYIEEVDVRNSDLSVKLSQGISNNKHFQSPKQVAANSTNDKIVRTGQFAYNRATTRNGDKISIAFREGIDCTVSSAYGVFQLKDNKDWLPHYLMLWFSRSEFDRYARYKSKGSAHEFFDFDEMKRVKVPKVHIKVQRALVDIYMCAKRAKEIASRADEQIKLINPALAQMVVHNKL